MPPLTMKEAAAEIGVSMSTMHIIVKQRKIAARRPSPNRVVFDRAEVERYNKSRTIQAAQPKNKHFRL